VQLEERVLTGFGRQREEVCSEGWPGWFAGEFRYDLVGSIVEHLNDVGANQLLGGCMEAVGVALDGVEQPGSWAAEFPQQCGG
jgi:hypothetical protein